MAHWEQSNRRELALVSLCGEESAQVVAAYLPTLLGRIAPGYLLRQQAISEASTENSGRNCGFIVLLPGAGRSVNPETLTSFLKRISRPAPILPVVVDEYGRGQAILPAAPNVLPILHVSPSDARIEHGGRFHLERDVIQALTSRLQALVSRASQWDAARRDVLSQASAAGGTCLLAMP